MIVESASFVKSASKLSQCPDSDLPEVAFIGRSNVGKSSVINMLANRNNLAKFSVKPGKTQLINFFLINDSWHLVDLPGYGYAKASKGSRAQWLDMIQQYMTVRAQLALVFVLVDASIPPQGIDIDFVDMLAEEGLPFTIIFNKIDKANQRVVSKNIKEFNQELKKKDIVVNGYFLASATKKRGAAKILEFLDEFLGIREKR